MDGDTHPALQHSIFLTLWRSLLSIGSQVQVITMALTSLTAYTGTRFLPGVLGGLCPASGCFHLDKSHRARISGLEKRLIAFVGTESSCQHEHGSSQPPLTPAPGDRMPLTRQAYTHTAVDTNTETHGHIHTLNNKPLKAAIFIG